MKKSLAVLAACMVLALCAVGVSRSAPAIQPFDIEWKTIYNDTLTSQGDSAAFSDEVIVSGARGWILTCVSTSQDTLVAPLMQIQMAGGVWVGTGIARYITAATNNTPTNAVGTDGALQHVLYSEWASTPAGTPMPVVVQKIRYKLKGNNARRLGNNSKAPTGTTIWRVMVVK